MKNLISPEHAEHLSKFKIPMTLLEMAGVRSMTNLEIRDATGLNGSYKGDDLGGIYFPFLHPITGVRTGARVRLDKRTADGAKYLMEPKCRHLFFAPGSGDLLKDTTVPVLFVESEKAALALQALAKRARRTYLIVATGGADGWKRKKEQIEMANGKKAHISGPSPDLDLIHFRNRAALIAFDSNAITNKSVRKARNAFRKELVDRGAAVVLVDIPDHDGTVNGPDDLIAIRGDEATLEILNTVGGQADNLIHLLRNDSGKAKPSLANAATILRDTKEWKDVLAFNEFSLYVVTLKPTPWKKPIGSNWEDADDIRAAVWLQHNGIDVTPRVACDAVQVVAQDHPFHPVREYLEGLIWDNAPRLDLWLSDYLGVAETEFSRAVGARWCISAIARIFQPGCQADCLLLLEGPQGIQKSTALRVLTGDEWFRDQLSDLDNKDSKIELHGKWIIELAELSGIRRSKVEQVKSFLSCRIDNFRPPYGRHNADFPRSNVFAASVNDATPFTDETGNRRFWPVKCGKINIETLTRDRDQLWAEAFVRYRRHEVWWLDTEKLNNLAKEEQDSRYEPGVWDQLILDWLERPTQRVNWVENPDDVSKKKPIPVEPFNSDCNNVTVLDVLLHAIGKNIAQLTRNDRLQVTKCLTHAEWKNERMYVGKSKVRCYKRPEP